MRVQQVYGRVALQREHVIERESVVGGPVTLEVGVLDSPVSHDRRRVIEFLVANVWAPFLNSGSAPLLGLVEELDKPDNVAAPAPELFAILAQDEAKGHVVDPDLPVLGEVSGLLSGLEDHLEVHRLPRVGDVDDPVGLLLVDAVPQRGHIRRGVPVPAIRLPHNEWDLLALDKHAHGPLTDLGNVTVQQVIDNLPEERIVE
mmetsp:Transcript_2983/g.8865  ORF Transcript_2983/g.8865 Transcript_2983/m.8865 type:complete len:202 (-) Transcript_2983:1092-1697(-)